MAVKFNDAALKEFEEIATHYPDRRATLLPALWLASREFGWVSEETMEYLAGLVGVPFARVYEVATFYTMYQRTKPGKFHLQVCQTLSCHLRGADEFWQCLRRELARDDAHGPAHIEREDDRGRVRMRVAVAALAHGHAMRIHARIERALGEERVGTLSGARARRLDVRLVVVIAAAHGRARCHDGIAAQAVAPSSNDGDRAKISPIVSGFCK